MDIKYYICMGTDIETLPFYPLAEGISKVVLRGNASYYSGTYIGTGEPFYHMKHFLLRVFIRRLLLFTIFLLLRIFNRLLPRKLPLFVKWTMLFITARVILK